MDTEPAGRRSILQVHPTRRCNLSCAHCYTSSGPDVRGELPVALLADAVANAARLGYTQLAVSGGEPFLYGDLPGLLAAAKGAGMRTSVTSNGTVLAPAWLDPVVPHLDLLAISIDGPPADHNLLRASSTAFERVLRHLPAVRDAGVPFGFVFTLTQFNADQLDWLVGFAADQGVIGVHIHPLTGTGRATTTLRGAEPDAQELLAARAEDARLAAAYPGMLVNVDALTYDEVAGQPSLAPGPDASVAELAPFLIVDDAGTVLPLTHDVDPSFVVGSLWEAPLAVLAADWPDHRCPDRGPPRRSPRRDPPHGDGRQRLVPDGRRPLPLRPRRLTATFSGVPNEVLRELAEEYWDTLLEASPTTATVLGDHRFDDRMEDFSIEAEAAYRARLQSILDRAGALDPGGLDADDRVTAGQLAAEIADATALIDRRMVELESDHMTGFPVGLLQSLPVMSAPDTESATKILERFRRVPDALEAVGQRYLDGAAAGRTPAAVAITRSLSVIEGYLASSLDEDALVTLAGPRNWDGESAWRDELRRLAEESVRPAYRRLADRLAADLLPQARDDEHCGLWALPDGPDLYAALVAHHTTVDLPPEELHRVGMEEVTEKLPAGYAEVGGRLFGIADAPAVLDRLRNDPSLRYTSGEEIMQDARRAFEAASAAAGDWFGRLPKTPCRIEVVPQFLAPDSPSAYYYPPPSDGSRGGTYYVNTDSPANKARYETASIAFHEAIPGHHLQLAIATELDRLPRFRRFSLANTAYVEGWGLYSERLADEMGLYETDLDRLGMLAGDSIRACRLVVDTGLHALGWTRGQAIEFMATHSPVSVDEVTIEIDRYIGMPGQALAYKVGQREIFRLRESARSQLGPAFDVKGFHDAVLGSGAVGLPMLGTLVNSWAKSRTN